MCIRDRAKDISIRHARLIINCLIINFENRVIDKESKPVSYTHLSGYLEPGHHPAGRRKGVEPFRP